MQVSPIAGGERTFRLTPREEEILGLILANEVIGEVGHGETGLAEGILESGPGEAFWGRDDITQEDAANFVLVLLKALGGFDLAVRTLERVI